ncbi:unnamed protein product [Symbiodinium pilosum]|uniref:Uncharacterized protein n=1 Tax=Symbiodinium pilosum TaxID=2952 RepID=A0A812SPU1_SYMPI|nr:unnamed protein product [Symbiodinium pilosum]
MSPKKVAKSAMKKAKAKAMDKTQPMKAKGAKKKPAASSVPHTPGRSEFNSAACSDAKKQPLGGLTGCDLAHAGAPASEALRDVWSEALLQSYKAYEKDAVSAWVSKDCLQGAPSCWHLFKQLHEEYDHNNQPKDAATSMVAFLPVKKFPKDFPKPVTNKEPYDAYILCRGVNSAKAVQSFVATAGAEHGLKVEGSKCSIGDFITIYKQKYPDELKQAAEDLKKVEFDYGEAKKLQLIGRDGNSKDAEYNCIKKNDVMEEVKKLADVATVRVDLRGSPDWCVDGTEKYIKVSVRGVVHWFSLRTRACRILRHRHLGRVPNGGEDCQSESQDLSESEVEILRQAPLAWNLSSIFLKEGA